MTLTFLLSALFLVIVVMAMYAIFFDKDAKFADRADSSTGSGNVYSGADSASVAKESCSGDFCGGDCGGGD